MKIDVVSGFSRIIHVVSAFRRTVVALALMTAAATAQQAPAPPATIAVRGLVTTANDVPLPRVRVVIPGVLPAELAKLGIMNTVAPVRIVLTDNAGRFTIPVAATATARLEFSKARYITQSVSISPRELTAPGAELRMRLALGGSISGQLIDRIGGPVMSATVTLRRADAVQGSLPLATTTTNDLGEYRFGGLLPGRFIATAVPPAVALGADIPDRQKVAAAAAVEGPPVDVGAGTDVGNIVLTIDTPSEIDAGAGNRPEATPDATASISGRVVGVDGRPIVRAVVHAYRPFIAGRQVETDQNGRYRIDRLVPGEYTIAARKYGFELRQYGQEAGAASGRPIVLKNGQAVDSLDVVLRRGAAITGTIVDEFGEPIQDVTVTAVQLLPNPGGMRGTRAASRASSRTDDRGQYRLQSLFPGTYFIQAVAAGELGAGTGYLPRLYPGVMAFDQATPTRVDYGSDIKGVDFSVIATPTYRVTGTVRDSTGARGTGTVALAVSERSGAVQTQSRSANIGPDGSFVFVNVGPGEYVVQASAAATTRSLGSRPTALSLQFAMSYVNVTTSDPPPVELIMAQGSTLTGRVRYEGAPPGPAPLLTISTLSTDRDRSPFQGNLPQTVDVQPDGSFQTAATFGPTLIQAEPQRSDWYLKSVLFRGQDLVDTPFDFGVGSTLRDVEVVISTTGATVTGLVVDDRGAPVRDYAVLVFPTFRDQWFPASRWVKSLRVQSRTEPFTITGLPPGDYWVAAMEPPQLANPLEGSGSSRTQMADPELLQALSGRATRIALGEGQTQDVALRLIPPAR